MNRLGVEKESATLTTDAHCQCLQGSQDVRTNKAAIVQFANGRLAIPSCFGKLYIMYKSVIKPGASIVAQPILPGILKVDVVDVLPMG